MNRHLALACGAMILSLQLQPGIAAAHSPADSRHDRGVARGEVTDTRHRDDDRRGERDDRRGDRRDWGDERGDWDDRHGHGEYRRDVDHHRHHAHRHPSRGHYVPQLPRAHRVVRHHGHHYYYSYGAWYRPAGRRYVVVDPPPGLVVPFLPHFSTVVHVGGIPHYRAGRVYYVWSPRYRGYVVARL